MLENYLLALLYDEERSYNLKQIREDAEENGCGEVDQKDIKKIFNLWKVDNWIASRVQNHINRITVKRLIGPDEMRGKITKRQEVARFILEYLIELSAKEKAQNPAQASQDRNPAIGFSVNELKEAYNDTGQVRMNLWQDDDQGQGQGRHQTSPRHPLYAQVSLKEIEDALFYLEKIDALKLEGSIVVRYNPMFIERLEMDNHKNYKKKITASWLSTTKTKSSRYTSLANMPQG